MFWEEKIEHFKKLNSTKDFNVPFTSWSKILKKIEDVFSITYDKRYPLTNWKERVKGLSEMSSVNIENLLLSDINYWVVITNFRPTGHNLVYDCNASLIKSFVKMHDNDYYIVDKKYSWLVYYNKETNSFFFKNKN